MNIIEEILGIPGDFPTTEANIILFMTSCGYQLAVMFSHGHELHVNLINQQAHALKFVDLELKTGSDIEIHIINY